MPAATAISSAMRRTRVLSRSAALIRQPRVTFRSCSSSSARLSMIQSPLQPAQSYAAHARCLILSQAPSGGAPAPRKTRRTDARLGVRAVEPLAHFLAGLEERHRLLLHRDLRAGARIAAGAGRTVLDREGAEAAQLDPVAARHRRDDLPEN